MSASDVEPDENVPTSEADPAADDEIGSLTVEDDPQGTVDPADLAGTASADDEDVS